MTKKRNCENLVFNYTFPVFDLSLFNTLRRKYLFRIYIINNINLVFRIYDDIIIY